MRPTVLVGLGLAVVGLSAGCDPSCSPSIEIPYDGIDQDCDGRDRTDVDADGFDRAADCDDLAASIHPGADEVAYDGVDQDCDGEDLDDLDNDGYGHEEDCNDQDARVHPFAQEIPYDGIDQDCNGEDLDDLDHDGAKLADDCDDRDDRRYPGAEEACDKIDNNCDDQIDVMIAGVTHGTVQAALDAVCNDGDTVYVGAGRWVENLLVPDRQLTLSGLTAAADTILDGSECTRGDLACSTVSLPSRGTSWTRFTRLTITGGSATVGGGILGVSGTLEARLVTITANKATYGGGIALVGGAVGVLDDITITANTAEEGAGIWANGSALSLDEGVLTGNVAGESGGAVLVTGSYGVTEIQASTLTDNRAGQRGGAVAFVEASGALRRSTLSANASNWGGAVYASSDYPESPTAITGNTFTTNQAEAGGALYLSLGCDLSQVANNDFVANEADIGGGIYVLRPCGSLGSGNTFTDNTGGDLGP